MQGAAPVRRPMQTGPAAAKKPCSHCPTRQGDTDLDPPGLLEEQKATHMPSSAVQRKKDAPASPCIC